MSSTGWDMMIRKLLHFLGLTLWGDQDLNVVVGESRKQNIRKMDQELQEGNHGPCSGMYLTIPT
uniref:Putative ascorbate peroxidase n=1 Tax=Capsicum annuum TaxID=4072 RepID=A0A1L7NTT8_CAPAN|nr:putative ascorbate peroxidase [Capsicum annuum]